MNNLTTGIKDLTKEVRHEVVKNSPMLLTVVGCAGVVGTAVLAVKATPKAMQKIALAKMRKGSELTVWEKVKAAWSCYIPAAVVGATTVASIVGSNRILEGRLETVAAAYQISEAARKQYQEKVLETVGPKKEEKIRAEVAKDRMENNPPVENVNIAPTDYVRLEELSAADRLGYESSIRGMYFETTPERLKNARNIINKDYICNGKGHCASLNDFYRLIGLSSTQYGDNVGWNKANPCEIDILPCWLHEEEQRGRVICFEFRNMPTAGYDDEMYDQDGDYAPWECH